MACRHWVLDVACYCSGLLCLSGPLEEWVQASWPGLAYKSAVIAAVRQGTKQARLFLFLKCFKVTTV